jgi:DNA polymerase III sliding clamp (beta) subunit (PCNA family)
MTINREVLRRALAVAASVANHKGTMPILANVLLQTTARDKLLIAASDLAISYVSTVPCSTSRRPRARRRRARLPRHRRLALR